MNAQINIKAPYQNKQLCNYVHILWDALHFSVVSCRQSPTAESTGLIDSSQVVECWQHWVDQMTGCHLGVWLSSDHIILTLLGLKTDGLVQERCNSSALAMELRLSCTSPSKSWCNPKYSYLIFLIKFIKDSHSLPKSFMMIFILP